MRLIAALPVFELIVSPLVAASSCWSPLVKMELGIWASKNIWGGGAHWFETYWQVKHPSATAASPLPNDSAVSAHQEQMVQGDTQLVDAGLLETELVTL